MLSQMILIDPDRSPDTEALPPRLVGLFNQALEQVLIVRGLLVDSTTFVAGQADRVVLHYEVSRPAVAELRVLGPGVDHVIESVVANPGPSRFNWDGLLDGAPVPEGDFQLIVTAQEGRNQYQRSTSFRVAHAPVDTLPFLTSLPGFQKLPETERPPRDWRPLGIATLLTGAAGGAALALSHPSFEGARVELGLSALVSIGTGLALSLRQPEARAVPAAIRYNALVDQTLVDRNEDIAAANVERRRLVELTVVEVGR
jgi:hypothetical protein